MQITVKEIKSLKKGSNNYGDWELFAIVSTEGKRYTTLAKGAEVLQAGSVIEPDAIILGEDKEGKEALSFKKFTLISGEKQASTPSAVPIQPAKSNDMSKEEWREKDRAEQWSRECNTCFMGIMELAGKGLGGAYSEKFGRVFDTALDWAMAHFQPTTNTAPDATTAKSDSDKPETDTLVFANLGEFFTACLNNLKISRKDVLVKIPDLKPNATPEQLGEAYSTLAEGIVSNEKNTAEEKLFD